MTSLGSRKERCPFDDDISRLVQGERIGEGAILEKRYLSRYAAACWVSSVSYSSHPLAYPEQLNNTKTTSVRFEHTIPTITTLSHLHHPPKKMSFSNTNTGDKPADPYKAANADTNVSVDQKIKDLSDFIDASKFGMMTTRDASSGKLVSRCMAVAAKESGGIDLLFHTNTESNKTDELRDDSHVNISFLNASGEWASISGTASVQTDRDLVKKHYSPILKTWLGDLGDGKHDGSENDPRIGVIRVKTVTATYAVVAKNFIARTAEMAQGAVTGKPASVNNLREVTEAEVTQWRSVH